MAEPNSSDSVRYLVDIPFSEEDGGPIRLRTEEEVMAWYEKEVAFWEWAFNYYGAALAISIQDFLHKWIKIRKGKGSSAHINANLQAARNGIGLRKDGREESFESFFHSGSRKAQTINSIKDLYGESAALGALIFALGADFSVQADFLPADFLLGAMQYNLIYQGISPETQKMVAEELDRVCNRAQQKFDELEQKSQALIFSLEEKGEGFDRARDVLKRYAPSRWSAFKSERKKDVDAAIKKINDTEELFKRQMEIKAPVGYWNEKKKRHLSAKENYFLFLAIFVPYSLLGTFALILGFPAFMVKLHYPQDMWHYIAVPLLLFWTTTIFWAGRVLVRLFLSEHHLAGDAEERAVMAQTYLALVNEDKADKQDRHIVLETLFRHSTDGIVKDDAAPTFSPSQLLSK